MIYAQIRNGVIVNTIVLDDRRLEPIFAEGFDELRRIDHLPNPPGMFWQTDARDPNRYLPPKEPPLQDQLAAEQSRLAQVQVDLAVSTAAIAAIQARIDQADPVKPADPIGPGVGDAPVLP